jgi:hypothetical protein
MLLALGGSDCERIGSGWLAQPVNAVSSLAYVAVGGWLLLRAGDPDRDRLALLTTGTALAGVGLASTGYHGPQPGWMEPVHDAAIVCLGVVLAGHTARRLLRGGQGRVGDGSARRWWVAAVMCGAAGLGAYVAGRTGVPLCRPESLWQPHAAWHALSALALGAATMALTPLSRP